MGMIIRVPNPLAVIACFVAISTQNSPITVGGNLVWATLLFFVEVELRWVHDLRFFSKSS